ncbi:nucleotidyltransferase domain-containing protein [Cytobacillus sp. Sa5YUA1]|uniref:Nucleotidyltransferase domain-containing protein n=1 Tax=Cytobacillus stercorigallinarum TaxID=2762240 RepID=A0ABR8QTM4_9BACI|nr:nucleotidyltransferase domain-containing protein [Cytobacillus stercorigallinarum]MBD7938880.1 nucleotidyltransferase domain-containing protein [Cytobacillus stercorigallinarum]
MLLERAGKRKDCANQILKDLSLLERWSRIGEVYVVGAYAYDLMVDYDIDIEVFCDKPSANQVFTMLAEVADHPQIVDITYHNYLNESFNGLYFKILFKNDDLEVWNIDMWLFPKRHKGPLSRDLVKDMQYSLTDESRTHILSIKEELSKRDLTCPSIFVYRAVLEDGIENSEQFYDWLADQDITQWTHWKPERKGEKHNGDQKAD